MLISVADFQTYVRETGNDAKMTAAIETAEAALAAFIGTDSLASRSVTETIAVPRDKSMVELGDGPLTALAQLTVDDEAVDLAGVSAGFWSVWYVNGFAAGSKVAVSYTAGWTTDNVPEAVKAAILITAGVVWARPDLSIARVSEADRVTRYNQDIVTPAARNLVRRWRRPL